MSQQSPPSTRVILSGVRSLTHLVYAASWLRQEVARVEGVVEVVVLDVGSGFGRARVDEPQVREYLPRHPRLLVTTAPRDDHWKAPPGLDRVLLSVGLPGTRAWARLSRAGHGRRLQVVVVDEGIGSFGNVRSRWAAYRRQGGSAVRTTVRTAVVTGAGRVLTDVRWSLYERLSDGWSVREEVAGEFRRRLSGSSARPGRAVYATQPWPEIGVMSEARYLSHLRAVGEQCAAAGMPLVLRPHPSEHLDRYREFDLVAGSAPAELTREVAEAGVVIGSNSTALLNLASVHGTPAVRVTAPELSRLEAALTPAQRALLDTFLPAPVPVEQLRPRLDGLRQADHRPGSGAAWPEAR